MVYEHHFQLPLPNGLHTRPASHLAERARSFQASVTFANERTGRTANAKSVLALVGTESRLDDPCRLTFGGDEAEAACTALSAFVESGLAECDETIEPVAPAPGEARIPRSLREAGLEEFLNGGVACRGLARGRLIQAQLQPKVVSPVEDASGDAAEQMARFNAALADVQASYAQSVAKARGTAQSVLRAHLSLLGDPLLKEGVTKRIQAGQPAAAAIRATLDEQATLMQQSPSGYMRERVLDLDDIGSHLLERLLGEGANPDLPALTEPCILAVQRLTPRQFLALDHTKLLGLVLGDTGLTSHTVILARSFGIPTLTGLPLAAGGAAEAILDANLGILITTVPDRVRAYYEREQLKLDTIRHRLAQELEHAGSTKDGRRLEVGANIATRDEAAMAFAQGAEGIGLFRTELLFADHTVAPGEDEQEAIYADVIRAAAGRRVTIRTLDAGGDKPVPFLNLAAEKNPFLGYRGVRLYAEHRAVVLTQMRALWRAARHGALKVMVPMVACLEEAQLARTLFDEAREQLSAEGVKIGGEVSFGLMIEVPSAAFLIDELSGLADFFSLGTNDLIQYFHAADRENEKVDTLHSALHPAFLRLLRQIVDQARARERWIGLCGEMAEDSEVLPLLVGLGLDGISLAAPRIPAIKSALKQLTAVECAARLENVLTCATREAVRSELTAHRQQAAPILASEFVLDGSIGASKAEVIHAMVDRLQLAGRTFRPTEVEEAIWRREDSYSTGIGHGIALPHCKSDDIIANTIVIARLEQPIDWASLDGHPINLVVLFVMRSSDGDREHMRSLARLSRLMMQDWFRSDVRAMRTPDELVDMITRHLVAPAGVEPPTPTRTP